jgi:3D (Asp-Asp-Asp) domain-containing protein
MPESDAPTVESTFGRKKQDQIDLWLESSNDVLRSECEKYGLKP